LDELQRSSEEELREEFNKFGFNILNFSIESIDCPKEDTDKLNSILHKKAELEQLGDTGYRTARGYDVLEAGAKGNGNASAFMGVGMGMQMGQSATVAGGIIPPSQAKESHDDMIACPKCGAEISAHSKFCPECGCKIVHECPKCGASVSPRQKFCPECGTKLYEEEK
jgi:membrane protease subunit (stomatin/prohibitin family)